MRSLSSYVSVFVILLVSLALTVRLIDFVDREADVVLEISRNNKSSIGYSVDVFGSSKFLLINKTIVGDILLIRGNYRIIINSTGVLLLETDPSNIVIVVTEGDIIIA